MYRLIPLRTLRRTSGVKFDEIIPSDIPKVDVIDKVIHGPNNKIRSLVKNDSYEKNINYNSRNVLEMYNDQHYQEYKEFKRRAAAERFNRGKNFIK